MHRSKSSLLLPDIRSVESRLCDVPRFLSIEEEENVHNNSS